MLSAYDSYINDHATECLQVPGFGSSVTASHHTLRTAGCTPARPVAMMCARGLVRTTCRLITYPPSRALAEPFLQAKAGRSAMAVPVTSPRHQRLCSRTFAAKHDPITTRAAPQKKVDVVVDLGGPAAGGGGAATHGRALQQLEAVDRLLCTHLSVPGTRFRLDVNTALGRIPFAGEGFAVDDQQWRRS